MKIEYGLLNSATQEVFDKALPRDNDLNNPSKFTKSDADDLRKIERLLEVREGTLSGQEAFVQYSICECGRVPTMYDFVFTGLVDARHDKSLILHTMIGSKLVVNRPRQIRCSACSRLSKIFHSYKCGSYGCAN